jgi:hypothetical protein
MLASLAAPASLGSWELSLGAREFERDQWMDGQGKVVKVQGYANMSAADGTPMSLKGFAMQADLRWQATARGLFVFSVPYYYQEFSPYVGDLPQRYVAASLGAPDVQHGDGLGDLQLAWRQVFLQGSAGRLGANLDFNAPTGLGPFSSALPILATGSGSFHGALALEAEAQGSSLGAWLQAGLPWDLGANQRVPQQFFAGFDQSQIGPSTAPGGNSFVRRDPGLEASLGFAWTWEQSESYHHRLILEAGFKDEGALRFNGRRVAETAAQSLVLVPQASFGSSFGFSFNIGWELPPLWAVNEAVASWGEFLVRADYRL